ncbi:MAG: response regulator [Fuerstiella sp.]
MTDATATSVLIVDDELNMLRTLHAILTREGYEVVTADDGEMAVQLCSERDFDVVLMDLRMPRMSGIQAFEKIRRHRRSGRFIMMSAYGEDHLKEAMLEKGAMAFVDKPLDIERVVHLIADATETAILVIEHDEETAQTLCESLEQHRYHVTAVNSAAAALPLIRQIRFDIIFIDVALPTMNGLELYLEVRSIAPTSVAIMVTGLDEECRRMAEAAIERTAYTMVHKPINTDQLSSLLGRIRRQRASNILSKPRQ